MVALLDAGHALTHALHYAGCLMPQDAREQALWVCVQAGPAIFQDSFTCLTRKRLSRAH